MAECFKCGAYIARGQGVRREVYTGHSSRLYYGRHISGSSGRSYGIRTICQTCAAQQAQQYRTGLLILGAIALALLAGLIIASIKHDLSNSKAMPPVHHKHTKGLSASRRFSPAAFGLTDSQGRQIEWVSCGITKSKERNPRTPFSDSAMATYFAGLCPDLHKVPAASLSAAVKLATTDIRSGLESCDDYVTPDPSFELDKQRFSPCGG